MWNEPNLSGFWEGADKKAYFELYDLTAETIKAISYYGQNRLYRNNGNRTFTNEKAGLLHPKTRFSSRALLWTTTGMG